MQHFFFLVGFAPFAIVGAGSAPTAPPGFAHRSYIWNKIFYVCVSNNKTMEQWTNLNHMSPTKILIVYFTTASLMSAKKSISLQNKIFEKLH